MAILVDNNGHLVEAAGGGVTTANEIVTKSGKTLQAELDSICQDDHQEYKAWSAHLTVFGHLVTLSISGRRVKAKVKD